MVTQAECSKKFKKLCDWTLATRKKEIRIAKDFSKLWANYATVRDSFSENTKQLNSLNSLLNRKTNIVETLSQLDNSREQELENVKENIRVLQEKIAAIRNNESEESERRKSLQQQLLQLTVLKTCTKTHISDRTPHVVRGFTASEESLKVIPFEMESGRLSKSEMENAVWEKSYQCSSYANEWEQLFATQSDPNS